MSWSAFITLTQPTYDGNENKTIIRRRERSVNEKSKLHLDEEFMLSSEKERERNWEEDLCKSGSADACFLTRDCAYKTIKTKTKKRLNFSFFFLFFLKCSSNSLLLVWNLKDFPSWHISECNNHKWLAARFKKSRMTWNSHFGWNLWTNFSLADCLFFFFSGNWVSLSCWPGINYYFTRQLRHIQHN